jgi:hypothetical protein
MNPHEFAAAVISYALQSGFLRPPFLPSAGP